MGKKPVVAVSLKILDSIAMVGVTLLSERVYLGGVKPRVELKTVPDTDGVGRKEPLGGTMTREVSDDTSMFNEGVSSNSTFQFVFWPAVMFRIPAR